MKKQTHIIVLTLISMLFACSPISGDDSDIREAADATVVSAPTEGISVPVEQEPTQVIKPTEAPTPTFTSFPLTSLRPKIEPLLFVEHDLPANWLASTFTTRLPEGDEYSQLPAPVRQVLQDGMAHALHDVFSLGLIALAVGVVIALLMPNSTPTADMARERAVAAKGESGYH